MKLDPLGRYAQAVAAEQAAWDKARDRCPGGGTFDREAWDSWRKAVKDTDEARKGMLDSLAEHPLRALELDRPGIYWYDNGSGSRELVRIARTPTVKVVEFLDSHKRTPLLSLGGTFSGPLKLIP